MTSISLADVDKIYDCSSQSKIYHYQSEHSEFHDFCLLLKNFYRSLGEDAKDDYWKKFFRTLKQYRFNLCAAPLPFNHSSACKPETIEDLRKHLAKCKFSYPNFTSAADNIFNTWVSLSQLNHSPMLDSVQRLTEIYKKNIALLIQEPRLIPAVKEVLATNPELRNIKTLAPSQLRGFTSYTTLIVVGATRWFPDYIFTAPRSLEIHVVQYSWIKDKWQPKPVFIGSINNILTSPSVVQKLISETEEVSRKNNDFILAEYLNSDEIIPHTINLSQIAKNFHNSSKDSVEDEDIEARLFLLPGEKAVFLDVDAKAIVIDLEEDGASQVNRISVADIEQGMFIVLRTIGSGDYIIPVANRILGNEAQHLRELQKLWKSRLRDAVRLRSLHNVSWELVKLGSKLAKTEQNIRNWLSETSIRPKDDRDFDAILCFVDLGNKLNEFHEAANKIVSAHKSAGHQIRQLLINRVCNSDLKPLVQLGKMDFKLPEVDGGSITAFRVMDINPEHIIVPASKIAHPFSVDSE